MKIYLAGPIFQCEDHECINWREEVKNSLDKIEVIDPMVRDYRETTNKDFKKIVESDKAEVSASDTPPSLSLTTTSHRSASAASFCQRIPSVDAGL